MSYEILNAHYWRRCHPETCCCGEDFVVLEDGMFLDNVESIEEGEALIEELTESEFLRTCGD